VIGDLRGAQPVTPEGLGLLELRERAVVRRGWITVPRQRDERRRARIELGASVHAGLGNAEAEAAGECEREAGARDLESVVPVALVAPLPLDPAVVEQRHAVQRHLDPAALARGDAKEGAPSRVVARCPPVFLSARGVGRTDDQQVEHREPTRWCVPARLRDQRAGQVSALMRDADVGRPEGEGSRRPIEQGAEHARRVGSRETEPFDGAIGCQ
jgi:hypothetical protein